MTTSFSALGSSFPPWHPTFPASNWTRQTQPTSLPPPGTMKSTATSVTFSAQATLNFDGR
jgi:hypothetical protein